MKRLHKNDVQKHFAMYEVTRARWDLLPVMYELQGHGLQTIDMHPTFGHIAVVYKEARKNHEYKDLKVFKIDTSTNAKVEVVMNPEYK